jgi:hypothetical protein
VPPRVGKVRPPPGAPVRVADVFPEDKKKNPETRNTNRAIEKFFIVSIFLERVKITITPRVTKT